MRLAFVLHHYFPYGGLQRDALRIAQACVARGHEVKFLAMEWAGELPHHMSVHVFPQSNWQHYRRHLAFVRAIKNYTKKHYYDGIIAFNKIPNADIYYAADPCFAATLAKRKWGKLYRYLPRYRSMLSAEKAIAEAPSKTHLLLISPQGKKDFQKFYHTEAERLHELNPGISRDRCWQEDSVERRHAMRRRFGLTPEKKMILMIGSAYKTKGVDRAIQAIAQLPENLREQVELFVVGKGNPKPFFEQGEKLRVANKLHFIIGSDEIPDWLFAADLLLHPAYLEAAGMAILEAIVAGLPVLVTENCGYAPYVKQAQAGMVLAEPFSQEQLSHALSTMLTAKEYSMWQKNAREFGKQHDLYSMPEQAAELIEKIIKEKKNDHV